MPATGTTADFFGIFRRHRKQCMVRLRVVAFSKTPTMTANTNDVAFRNAELKSEIWSSVAVECASRISTEKAYSALAARPRDLKGAQQRLARTPHIITWLLGEIANRPFPGFEGARQSRFARQRGSSATTAARCASRHRTRLDSSRGEPRRTRAASQVRR